MDNPVIPPIPDDSSSNFQPAGGFGSPSDTPVVATPNSSGNSSAKPSRKISGKVVATLFGMLLLIGGVGAGLVLVNQQQILKQKAATGSGCNNSGCFCDPFVCDQFKDQLGGTGGTQYPITCYVVKQTCPGGSNGACTENPEFLDAGQLTFSDLQCGKQQIDMGCKSAAGVRTAGTTSKTFGAGACSGGTNPTTAPTPTNPPGWGACGACPAPGGDCFLKPDGSTNHPMSQCQMNDKGVCTWNPSLCGNTGGGGGGSTPSLKACGETCSSDSQCYPTGANGGTERCVSGTCQNTACLGKTVPGRNCDCSALNACGERCSASLGLCQATSQCGYIAGGTQCAPPGTEGNTNNTYCIPGVPNNGYTIGQCTGIATIYLKKPDGTVVSTQADVQAACAATPATAQCTNIKAYDTNWNLLTPTQLSALTSGSKVRFTVMGTTTSGNFDKARFTINGTQTPEVTTLKPGTAEFYYEYTVPAGTTTFSVTAQIHQQQLNTWN